MNDWTALHSACSHGPRSSKGFTLVELLVATAVGLVVVLAASTMYINARDTQRVLSDKAQIFESAKIALDIIGRDLEIAGYYPSERPAPDADKAAQVVTVQAYSNPSGAVGPAAYNSGVFGCQRGRLSGEKDVACAPNGSASPDADGLVVNYYTMDSADLSTGNRADCLRQDPAGKPGGDPINDARVAAGSPIFVSNRYSLGAVSVAIEGQTIKTFNLACWGNGNQKGGYQPLVVGIDQLRFFYLLSGFADAQYVRASAVADTAWGSVAAVRVCLVARSLQPVRLQGSTPYNIVDCDGVTKTYSDGVERRIFSQVFPLKNYLP